MSSRPLPLAASMMSSDGWALPKTNVSERRRRESSFFTRWLAMMKLSLSLPVRPEMLAICVAEERPEFAEARRVADGGHGSSKVPAGGGRVPLTK